MQTGESPEHADLVFATREVRKQPERINLDLLCPTETEEGKQAGTNCSNCQFCWREWVFAVRPLTPDATLCALVSEGVGFHLRRHGPHLLSDAALSVYNFSPAERYAVWTAHGEKCYICTRPIDLKTMEVDHLVPESLIGDPGSTWATRRFRDQLVLELAPDLPSV
jgi:hypothetical protein